MLELRDVVKHYRIGGGETVRAIDGVSLTLAPGELLALYGPSGAGKTTLLMLVAALLVPDEGTVLLDGRDLSGLTPREAAAYRLCELGFVRQPISLLPGASVLDNAALKLMGAGVAVGMAHRRVMPLLERLGLGERAERRVEQLSMGERQRVMIARALSTEPKLVLADEPTASLDRGRAQEVLRMFEEIRHEQRTSVLLVTHDLRVAAQADQVHALSDGTLADGERERLLLSAANR